MATIALCRGALRRSAAPVTLGLSTGLILASRQRPMRLDAAPATSRSLSPATDRTVAAPEEWLRPEVIKQLSGGSLAGFLTGLLVSVFSKTLVLLGGVVIVAVEVASRCGIDILGILKIRERIGTSRVLSSLNKNPTFKLAFGTTFALAAFMQF